MPLETTQRALYGPPKVGGDTLSWCTKCKMDLAHVIVSMVDGQPSKVICKTCKSTHKYRKNGEPVSRSPGMRSISKSPRSTPASRVADLFEKRMIEGRAKAGHTYAPTQNYLVGDMIQHAKFGIGFVEEIRSGGKILVLFREGEKVLVYTPKKPDAAQ